jgi:hypothetical protein
MRAKSPEVESRGEIARRRLARPGEHGFANDLQMLHNISIGWLRLRRAP